MHMCIYIYIFIYIYMYIPIYIYIGMQRWRLTSGARRQELAHCASAEL